MGSSPTLLDGCVGSSPTFLDAQSGSSPESAVADRVKYRVDAAGCIVESVDSTFDRAPCCYDTSAVLHGLMMILPLLSPDGVLQPGEETRAS